MFTVIKGIFTKFIPHSLELYLYPRGIRPPYLSAQVTPLKITQNINNTIFDRITPFSHLNLSANYISKCRYLFNYISPTYFHYDCCGVSQFRLYNFPIPTIQNVRITPL